MKISAKITLRESNDGGRVNAIFSGYRPTIRAGHNKQSDCVISFSDRESLKPGESGLVAIDILHPEKVSGMTSNQSFILTEGLKEVASGTILSIVENTFKQGDILLFNDDEVELLEIKRVFGVTKAKIRILKTIKSLTQKSLNLES